MIVFLLINVFTLIILFNIFILVRKRKYTKFREVDIDKLCHDYDSWQIRNGLSYQDNSIDSAYIFCRNKFPVIIPNKLLYSFKKINMKTMLTDDMKSKFEKYLINNN